VCRTILGFWAGHRNSKIRVNLAKAWEKDPVLFITNNRISRADGEFVYQKQFLRSKFCICPAGSQVNSARIAEALHYGCVPCKFLLLKDIHVLKEKIRLELLTAMCVYVKNEQQEKRLQSSFVMLHC
jgi:hypothetical protein